MSVVSVYYICTGPYIQFLGEFVDKIRFFMPQCEKQLVIITDSTEDLANKYSVYGIKIHQHYIMHYVWPINTLFKMKYMLDFWYEADYAFYFNANLMPHNGFGSDFTDDKLYFAKHWTPQEYKTYNESQNPQSSSYIDYNKLPPGIVYCQGGFFGGCARMVRGFCEDVFKMLKIDLLKNVIPRWHDESYLNKWLYNNFNRVGLDIRIVWMRDVGVLVNKNFQKSNL